MSCQVVIACVTNAVGDLARTTPQSWEGWFRTQSDGDQFLMVLVSGVATFLVIALILLALIALVQCGCILYRESILPERPRKRRYGAFVED